MPLLPHLTLLTRRPAGRVRLAVWLVAAVLAVLFCEWMVGRPPLLKQVENLGYDRLLLALPPAPHSDVVLVDIDEKSLAELGQWPLPRYQVARLLDKMYHDGTAAIGVDILFTEPDRLSLDRLKKSFQQDLNVDLGLKRVPAELMDNDAILAQSLARTGAVLGVWFDFEGALPTALPAPLPLPRVLVARTPRAPETLPIPRANRALQPLPQLAAALRATAFHNALPDPDGKIRRAPILIQQGHQIFPTLALTVVMLARGDEPAIVKVSDAGVEQVRFGTITILTDHQGNMLLPFRPDTMSHFDQISAADLLAGRVAPERLRGKIAFLGSTANATSDTHPTPLDRQLPGILTQAVAADAMLRQDFLHTPGWGPAVQLFMILLSLAGTAFMLTRYLLWLCAAVCGVVMAGLWFAALWLLARHGLVISPVAPMLALGTGAVLLGLIRFRGEERGIIQMSRELAMAQDCAIIGLVSVVETHDAETGRHIIRTRHYVRLLAESLSSHPRFCHGLTPENIEAIVRSAALHDIGKVGVPDAILKKPGRLNEAETLTMRQHTLLGKRILEKAYRLSGADPRHSFLAHGVQIACSHHECWDGSGYPSGLKGEEIPIAARLMALADVYDALRSKRPYKESMPHEEVQACIQAESGTRFDPDVVRAFRDTHEAFHAFSIQHADDDGEEEERAWSADLVGLEI